MNSLATLCQNFVNSVSRVSLETKSQKRLERFQTSLACRDREAALYELRLISQASPNTNNLKRKIEAELNSIDSNVLDSSLVNTEREIPPELQNIIDQHVTNNPNLNGMGKAVAINHLVAIFQDYNLAYWDSLEAISQVGGEVKFDFVSSSSFVYAKSDSVDGFIYQFITNNPNIVEADKEAFAQAIKDQPERFLASQYRAVRVYQDPESLKKLVIVHRDDLGESEAFAYIK